MTKKNAQVARTAFVTGAGGAVGRATCRELADHGWRVFAGVHGEAVSVERSDTRIVPFVFDITDGEAVAEVAEEVDRELAGRGLDGLVNAAGIIVRGPLELLPPGALRRQFEVNVLGHVAVTQSLLPD